MTEVEALAAYPFEKTTIYPWEGVAVDADISDIINKIPDGSATDLINTHRAENHYRLNLVRDWGVVGTHNFNLEGTGYLFRDKNDAPFFAWESTDAKTSGVIDKKAYEESWKYALENRGKFLLRTHSELQRRYGPHIAASADSKKLAQKILTEGFDNSSAIELISQETLSQLSDFTPKKEVIDDLLRNKKPGKDCIRVFRESVVPDTICPTTIIPYKTAEGDFYLVEISHRTPIQPNETKISIEYEDDAIKITKGETQVKSELQRVDVRNDLQALDKILQPTQRALAENATALAIMETIFETQSNYLV